MFGESGKVGFELIGGVVFTVHVVRESGTLDGLEHGERRGGDCVACEILALLERIERGGKNVLRKSKADGPGLDHADGLEVSIEKAIFADVGIEYLVV